MTLLTPPGYLQGGTYSAKLLRMYDVTAPAVPDLASAFSARQGFYSGRVPTATNPSGMDVLMGACAGIVQNTFVASAGDYRFVNDAAVQVTPAASSPTLNRHDILGFQVKDHFYDGSGLNTIIPAVVQGTNSAGTPADPALPASFIPVVRAVINAGVTSPTLQGLQVRTVNDGGLLPVADAAERTAITTPWDGMQIYRRDRDWAEIYDGAAWRVVTSPAVCSSTADRDSAITSPWNGMLAYTADTGKMWHRHAGGWREYPAVPLAQMRQTVTQTLLDAVFTDITFTTEDWDTFAGHSTSVTTARYTGTHAGVYDLAGGIAFTANASGVRIAQWAKNGTALPASDSSSPSLGAGAATRLVARPYQVFLNGTTDYVTLQGFQDRGGSLDTISSGAAACSMTVGYRGA